MWSQLALCLLVGFTYASSNSAWKESTEYEYLVDGRTLSSLHETSDQYSGIFLKARLHLLLRPDGKLQGKLTNTQFAQIQGQLPDGWDSQVPESQLSYKQLPISQKPFQMTLEDGLIKQLIVEKDLSNWEANIIKSVVSQFQLDLKGRNLVSSPMNHLPKDNKLDRVFKTMEETVTGETETLYEIHHLPEYIIQSQPWLVPQQKLIGNGKILEVTKFKNFSNAESRPSYHYGFAHIEESEPSNNKMGEFFVRESYSRAILTGELNKYAIQNSYTVNKNMFNPSSNTHQKGSVISKVNVTLVEVKTPGQAPEDLSNPTEIGNLVYTFETPFSKNNKVHQKIQSRLMRESFESSEEQSEWRRSPRSISMKISKRAGQQQDSEEYVQEQPKPKLSRAPESPLLPFMSGYHGKSIRANSDFDVKANALKIAREISEEINDPEKILSESTLEKYTILNTIVRLMTEDEIRSTAEELYSQSQDDQSRLSWMVYRDSVAEAGTGPAFLNIQKWIASKKIEKREAAEVISTMANSVRVPTEEYMKKFFELAKSSEVKQQEYLNETAILSYTDLVYKVYVSKNESHNQYPVHSFGSFNTKEGREFIDTTVIPYLEKELNNAVSQTDAQKIHIYIRALGNVANRKILEVFEPYLEGEKAVSQFQRLWMVISLDRLASCKPSVARSVFYKIYQNTAEIPEIRVAAVYQLMRTNPPVEMLQRMAQYTHTDVQEEVNAAVKSVLEHASNLRSSKTSELREAAQSAVPLLTKKQYGLDQSYLHLQQFVSQEMGVDFRHQILGVSSKDSNMPKILKIDEENRINGMRTQYFSLRAVVSSIRDLTNVLYRQTEKFEQERQQRSQEHQKDGTWSSAKIAQLMNYEHEEREQLESIIFAELEHAQKLWSVDNQTVEQLPEFIRQKEEQIRNGKQFSYVKLRQVKEMALSFPTEMGIPFLYTYDMPMLVRFEGKIRAQATPQISKNNKLNIPEKIVAEIDAYATISGKEQCHLSFVTPFDHQTYMAGYDKNLQAHIPAKAQVEIDVKSKQVKIEIAVQERHQDARLLHFSSYPYTCRSDIMTIRPVALRPNTIIIKPEEDQHRSFDIEFGKKQTGLAFRAWGHHPVQSMNLGDLFKIWQSDNMMTVWDQWWDKATLCHSEANIRFLPSQSTVNKITLKYRYDQQYKKQSDVQTEEDFLTLSQLSNKLESDEPKQRQQQILKHVGSGIQSAHLYGSELCVESEGDKKYQHVFGYAYAKSNAGPISKALVYYKNQKDGKTLGFEVRGEVPNTNGLDLTYSLETKPSAKYSCRFQSGQPNSNEVKISAKVNMERSDARQQYLMTEEPLYHVCKQQMQQGNFQLPACQNMTIRANYLDDIHYQVQFENLNERFAEYAEDAFKGLFVYYYPITEVTTLNSQGENTLSGKIHFQPQNLRQANVSVVIKDQQYKFVNISTRNEMVKTLLVPHPVFHLSSRIAGVLRGDENFRPTCVIDQNVAQTFSNKSYSLPSQQQDTVVMQYIPKDARVKGTERQTVEKQIQEQLENYVVIARQVSNQQKEIILNFNHPKTQGKTVEIQMKPTQGQFSASNPAAQVLVDGQQTQFDDKKIADLYNGFVEIYALPNGEVKVEIKDAFYLIFDGQRVKLTATNGKLRDSIYGLCGRFSKDQYEDFTVPAKCVVRTPEQFVESYQVASQKQRHQRSGKAQNECIAKVLPLYADVISDSDVGRSQWSQKHHSSGTQLRPRYVEENGELCFTIRPLPVCNGSAKKTVTKNIAVHCIQGTKTAYYLKSQIDQGGNPDFSRKSETRTVRMEVPQECN